MLPDTHTQPITDSCVQFFTESFHTTYLEVVNPPSYKLVIRLRCFVPTYLSQPSLICDFCPSDQRFARKLVCSSHPASFRFHLTMDTLAVQLYISHYLGMFRTFTCESAPMARKRKEDVLRHPLFYVMQYFYFFCLEVALALTTVFI